MMNKKSFCKKMIIIEKMWRELKEKEKAFGNMLNTNSAKVPLNRDFFYLTVSAIETAVIGRDLEILAWIFFEYGGEFFINNEDGSIIDIENWGDVYDFLIKENESPVYKGEYEPEVITCYGLDTLEELIREDIFF